MQQLQPSASAAQAALTNVAAVHTSTGGRDKEKEKVKGKHHYGSKSSRGERAAVPKNLFGDAIFLNTWKWGLCKQKATSVIVNKE